MERTWAPPAEKTALTTLVSLTRAATETIPGVTHASICLRFADGAMDTLIPTDGFVAEADGLQYELGEGPCLDAANGAALV